jgi:hypothetical protein
MRKLDVACQLGTMFVLAVVCGRLRGEDAATGSCSPSSDTRGCNIYIDIRDHGAVANDGKDDTKSIQRALDAAKGGLLFIPGGTWNISASNATESLLWRYPTHIVCSGIGSSILAVSATVATTTDVIRLNPEVTGEAEFGWSIEGCRIKPVSGNPARDGFFIDLDGERSEFLAKFTMRGTWIGPFSRRAFAVNKSGPGLDGFFTSTIEDSGFSGSGSTDYIVYLNRSGDSISISRTSIAGGGVGIYTAPVAGAAQQVFEDLNITSDSGAIYAKGGTQLRVRGGQYEQTVPSRSGNAMITLDDATEAEISGVNLNGHDFASNIELKGRAARNRVFGCVMSASATAGREHFILGQHVGPRNDIGLLRNSYFVDGRLVAAPAITNSATTVQIGLWTELGLHNSWMPVADKDFDEGLRAVLLPDGMVYLRGEIAPGDTAAGTIIAVLPPEMRPLGKIRRISAEKLRESLWAPVIFNISPQGEVRLANERLLATDLVVFSNSSFHIYP